ncbi:MAG: ATP-binding protein [Nitrososphaerales archaeon]
MSTNKTDYFSLAVKTRRQDLFDREKELLELEESLSDPLTIVLGIRRLGKSSLVAVALGETKRPSMSVDLRGIGPNPSPVKVLERFESGVNSLKSKKLWDRLARISGVSLFSFGVQFSKSSKSRPQLQTLLDSIHDYARETGKQFVIAVDEVQEARGLAELPAALAHSYDYNKNLHFVLAGSEVGVLHDFIGVDNPDSHLYGRKMNYVVLPRFPRELSLEFLKKGFEAYKKKIPESELEDAVNKLDGIVGWLVLYGHEALSSRTTDSPPIQSIVNQAIKIVESETSKILVRSKHYRFILKALASGPMKWKNIYDFVQLNEGHVSESVFNDSLTQLAKYGIVVKNTSEDTYAIPDPIMAEFAKKL